MTLLFSMLPLYLFGNLHCLGMCGPLVMMIGHHRFRYYYFLGRTLSFSLAGMAAGALGAVSDSFFKHYHLAEATTFLFGAILIILGIYTLAGWPYPGQRLLSSHLAGVNHSLSLLMLRDQAFPAFLFGFFTLALPCGQTLIVFSACALSGELSTGLINGFAFAILTSPSLFLAMKAHAVLKKARHYYQTVVGISALIVGSLAILRGIAELQMISHWVFSSKYHIVIF